MLFSHLMSLGGKEIRVRVIFVPISRIYHYGDIPSKTIILISSKKAEISSAASDRKVLKETPKLQKSPGSAGDRELFFHLDEGWVGAMGSAGGFAAYLSLSSQKPSGEQRLHVLSAISRQIHVNRAFRNPIDDPMRFEKGFPVFLHSERKQFLGMASPLRKSPEILNGLLNLGKDMVRCR